MHRIYSRADTPKILNQLLNLHQEIQMKSEILACLREMSQSIGRVSFCHAQSKKSHSRRSRVEDNTVRTIFIEEKLEKDMRDLSELAETFMAILGRIDDVRCRELLTYRYLCGNTWEQVAEKMNYSYIHVLNRLHPLALKSFNENLNNPIDSAK